MAKRKVSNPLALAVLSYLTREPMHPYDLVRTLRANGDARSVRFTSASAVYMVIEQLAKAGFVEERETARVGRRPEHTTYALTEAGRQEWHDWLRQLIAEPGYEYPQFVVALSLMAALPPGEAAELLRQRRETVAHLRAETRAGIDKALVGGLPPLFLADEEYRLALMDAEGGFIDGLIRQITDPETGWAPSWAEHLTQAPPEPTALGGLRWHPVLAPPLAPARPRASAGGAIP
jgi:DNA-binding PadR family transcriptional regulator